MYTFLHTLIQNIPEYVLIKYITHVKNDTFASCYVLQLIIYQYMSVSMHYGHYNYFKIFTFNFSNFCN